MAIIESYRDDPKLRLLNAREREAYLRQQLVHSLLGYHPRVIRATVVQSSGKPYAKPTYRRDLKALREEAYEEEYLIKERLERINHLLAALIVQ